METEVTGARMFLAGIYGELPTSISPQAECHVMLYAASGLMSAALRTASGRVFHRLAPVPTEGYMFLIPPGATLELSSKGKSTEALLIEFRCPQLRFYPSNARYGLTCPDGSRQALKSFARLSSYDVALLRPVAEDAYKNLLFPKGSGRHIFGVINFHMVLGKLFVVPKNAKYWGAPGVVLEKTIEADPVSVKLKDMARKIGCTPEGLRKSFKALTGVAPSYYKLSETLHFARYWILHTRLPFKAVSMRMGFGSASYFTRYVLRHTGKTPKEIRASGRWPCLGTGEMAGNALES